MPPTAAVATSPNVAATPELDSVLLFAAGLLGAGTYLRRLRQK
jgi:hypothetical protein